MRNRETKASNIVLCFDGGASPNPGKGAWAAVLYFGTPTLDPRAQRDQDELGRGVGDLGGAVSNNYAEYCALIGGLRLVEETLRDSVPLRSVAVAVLGDSQLVINQMTGVFSVRDPSLKILNAIASSLVDKFRSVTFNHIDRKYNTVADSMANTQINKTTYSGAIPYYPNLMLASTLTIDNSEVIASNDLGAGFSECINMIDAKFLRDCLPVQVVCANSGSSMMRVPP
ncbi:hypothetical protein BCR33DRAFT_498860 [Rhizoclosmatium globosum]|uniref:RNase H type-1 domain-containing protein n=1 Tax=Rhizoclosmatium globosum TaxID=329046 RepID=A0A1Y2CX81_9FUNG|nr:hypothetical protein BCR33DRAFT_498860 [Rhizoclosmatium globosum]|eukprot:ORY50945.1 hypothetical protein BCR33DRAFT_498860 [Rhizoclosmatium globosum]